MSLSDRKKSILRAVVDEYIETAEPISSKGIQERHLPDCSSATIRNELSALESMGYLVQPHISAGRVPSEKAFRLYVDELMQLDPLTGAEIELIDRYFQKKITGMEEIVTNVAKALSDATNYPSIIVKQSVARETVQNIRLLKLFGNSVLAVLITDKSVFKDSIIETGESFDQRTLNSAELWLNRIFSGKLIADIVRSTKLESIAVDFANFREIYEKVLDIIVRMSSGKNEVITEGTGKILSNPEYSDVSAARNFLSTIEQKEQLAQIFDADDLSAENENASAAAAAGPTGGVGADVHVKIGGGQDEPLANCAVVSTKMTIGELDIGSLGVIGPVRMNYKKVVSVLDHIGKLLDNILQTEAKTDKNDQTDKK